MFSKQVFMFFVVAVGYGLTIPCLLFADFKVIPEFSVEAGVNDNIRNATEGREESGYSLNPSFELNMVNKFSPAFSFGFGAEIEGTKHLLEELQALNSYLLRGKIQASGRITKRNSYRIRFRRSSFTRGDIFDEERRKTSDHIKNTFSIRLRHRFGKVNSLTFRYRNSGKKYSAIDREDTLTGYSIGLSRIFSGGILGQVGIQPQENISNIRQNNFNNMIISAFLVLPLGKTTTILNSIQYHMKEYPYRTVGEENREDRRTFFTISLNQEISKGKTIGFSYTSRSSDSNLETVQSSSNIFRGSLEIGF